MGSIATREMKDLFKFIFSFLPSGVEAKSGFELRHSTRNASKIQVSEERSDFYSACLACLCAGVRRWYFFRKCINISYIRRAENGIFSPMIKIIGLPIFFTKLFTIIKLNIRGCCGTGAQLRVCKYDGGGDFDSHSGEWNI